MFLLDTNVWLEVLLDQERAAEARQFVQGVEAENLAITEFSLYSLGVILTRLKKDEVFEDFLSDTVEDSGVIRLRLELPDLRTLITYRRRFGLDFDDAYQCVAAEKYGCTLVSLDSDFDKTPGGRKTPREVTC
jgi:predicted nucleic acid-binding protein